MLIIQWWHPYFAPCYYIMSKVVGKKIKKIFVCHNVFPHERFPFDQMLTRLTLQTGDGFLVHSESDAQDLLQIKPNAQYMKNPIPTYDVFKVKDLTKREARAAVGESEDAKLILFFGFVREYKGLKHLLEVISLIKETLIDVKLMVVGSFGDDKEDYLEIIRDNKIQGFVTIVDDYIPDNEIEKYFAACDVVIAPYESATQSGIVQLAYEFEKPVIVTSVGGLPDVVEEGKTGYIVAPRNPEDIAKTVLRFYSDENQTDYAANIKSNAVFFSWEKLIKKILDTFGKY